MIAKQLWQQFGGLRYEDIPPSARTVAKQCFLDWMGCAVAGSNEPVTEILHAEFSEASGPCSIIASDQKTSARAAAMINGAAGHALDFDDTHMGLMGHPSVPVAPAVLATAQQLNASGEQLLTAYIVGIEIECRLGILVGTQHYAKGWHVTSTIGIFGAVAGVSHLLGLSVEQFCNAFGLAASQSSGLKSNFGTMAKPFHAGHAAERGLISATLAEKGFTANASSFEGNQGLLEAASGGELNNEGYQSVKNQWLVEHTLFKYNAACYLTHASIEALKQMKDYATADNCAEITIEVNPSLLNVCGIENPTTGLEAKFSLRANAAITVIGLDTTDPATYSNTNLYLTEVQRILDKVKITTNVDLTSSQSKVVFEDLNGGSKQGFYDTGIPEADLPLQQKRLEQKFLNIVNPILGDNTEPFKQTILTIEQSENIRLSL